MNSEMLKGVARWLMTGLGAAVAGWFAAKGWFSVDQVTSMFNSELLLGLAVALLSLLWNLLSKRFPALAAAIVKVIPDTKVVTTPEVAAAVPSDAVVSNAAVKVVSK